MPQMMLCSRCGALASLASEPPLCSRCAASMPAVAPDAARPRPASAQGRDEGFDPPPAPRPERTGAVLGFCSSSLLVVASIYVLLTVPRRDADDRTYPMLFLVLGLIGLAMALFAVGGTRRGAIANAVGQVITALFWGVVLVAGLVFDERLPRGEWFAGVAMVAALAGTSIAAAAYSLIASRRR